MDGKLFKYGLFSYQIIELSKTLSELLNTSMGILLNRNSSKEVNIIGLDSDTDLFLCSIQFAESTRHNYMASINDFARKIHNNILHSTGIYIHEDIVRNDMILSFNRDTESSKSLLNLQDSTSNSIRINVLSIGSVN